MGLKLILSSPKSFLLSFILPLSVFIHSLFKYQEPGMCGGQVICGNTIWVDCDSYEDFLSGMIGELYIFLALYSLLLSLNLIGLIYYFLNNKNKLGWLLTTMFLAVIFILPFLLLSANTTISSIVMSFLVLGLGLYYYIEHKYG